MKNQRDVMKCNDAMIGKDNEKDALLGPRLMKTPKQCMHTLKGPYPGVEGEQGYKKEKAMMLMRGSKG